MTAATLHPPLLRDRAASAVAIGLGLFCLVNGLSMLVDPIGWFWRVPGVPESGGYNAHFIRDIGMIYALTGGGLVAGVWLTSQRIALWGAAALWLMMHALFHLWEVAAGICAPSAIPRDFLGVTLPGLLATMLAVHAARRRIA